MSEIETWADRLEAVIAGNPGGVLDRVRVVAETKSTQDSARDAAGGKPGLVLIAGRQTGGRGRLGRSWFDDGGHGLAVSMVIDAHAADGLLAIRAGLAACQACETALGTGCQLRWPNDVLEPGGGGRKLAGVLVEVREGLAVVGIGINITQGARDWPAELGSRAVSLAQLGCGGSRIDVACLLLRGFAQALEMPAADALAFWREREWLIGRRCALIAGSRRIVARVEGITPAGTLAVVHDDGRAEDLASASVSIDHDAAI